MGAYITKREDASFELSGPRDDVLQVLAQTSGIDFRAVTYQEVFLNLARQHRDENARYADYLAESYL